MYRIDNAKAAASLPTPAAAGPVPDGFFASGTLVTSDWLNAIQEEICYLIEQKSIVLDKTDATQFYTAIASMVADGPVTSGISAVVDDPAPKLGAALFVNGFKFNSASGGHVELIPTTEINLNGTTHLIHTNIYHLGDLDNYIQFGTNTINFVTNNTSKLDLTTAGARVGGAGSRITTCYNDSTMAANSDTALTSQAAFKAYADAKFALLNISSKIIGSKIDHTAGTTGAVQSRQWSTFDSGNVTPPIPTRYFCPVAGTIKNLYGRMRLRTSGAGSTLTSALTLTIYKNDTATSLTYTISAGQAKNQFITFSVTGVNVSVSAGDYIYMRTDSTISTGAAHQEFFNGSVSLEYAY